MDFESYIKNEISKYKDTSIKDAMFYMIEGGKRFREKITFSILKGFNISEEMAYPSACAHEFIQTYSLIHDDMPCMDDDELRRGKPSCHIKYGEGVALLVGDAFLTHAFSCIADTDIYDSDTKAKLISALSSYAGLNGMIYGQLLDIKSNANDEETINLVHENKTSALFKYSCVSAMYIAKNYNYKYFEELGKKIGIIFQYQDDLFDVIKNENEMGKSLSDKDNNKFTAINLFSNLDELKEYINKLFIDLDIYLKDAPFNTIYLKEILNKMKER